MGLQLWQKGVYNPTQPDFKTLLLRVLDFYLQSSAVGGRVRFWIDEPGGVDELDILPLRVPPETGCCYLHGDLMTIGCDTGYSGKFEDGVCWSFQDVNVLLPGLELGKDCL